MAIPNLTRPSAWGLCALTSLVATAAHADDAPPLLDRVEVTGEAGSALDQTGEVGSRVGLSLRETPAAVEILDQAQLQQRGARSSIEALNSAAGVVAANLPSSPGISAMRGFSGGAISLLFDGVRQTAGPLITRDLDSWSFERIEVLKGPASVLYGEGALAGAINLVPKRPQFDALHWQATLAGGSRGFARAGADVNLPLGETAALRAVASDQRSDGPIDDSNSENRAGLIALALKPSDNLLLDIALDTYRDAYDTPYWGTPLVPRSVARDPSNIVTTANGFVLDRALRDTNFNVADGYSDARADWARSRLAWRINDTWRFVNELDHYDADRTWQNTETFTWNAADANLRRGTTRITHDHSYWIERASLAADSLIGDRRNRFSIGAEYSESSFYNERRFGTTTAIAPYAPQRGLFPRGNEATLFPGAGNRVDFDSTSQVTALFAENAFNPAPHWLLLAGLRKERIALQRRSIDYNSATDTRFERDYSPLSWRAGAVFDAAATTQLYAQYSRAVAPVGSLFLISQANSKFDLTSGDAVEFGIKSSLWNGRLDLTAAAYGLRQDGIITRDPANANVSVQGGRQSSRGIEFSATARVSDALQIQASAAALHARLDELIEAGGANRAGNTPALVPERQASLFATYAIADTPLSLNLGLRHVGRWYANNANTTRISSHNIVDAGVSWRLPLGELALRGRNLSNALYAEWTGGAADQLLLGAPRSVELSWTVNR